MASAAERSRPPWPICARRWSRGPTLCKLFRKAKTSFRCKLAIAKLLGQASSSTSPSPAAPPSAPLPPPPSQTQRLSMQRSISTSLSSPSNSVRGGAIAIAIANCLRRHSDAIAPPGLRVNPSFLKQRYSLDSVLTKTDVNNEEHILPNVSRLGSPPKNNFYTTRSLTHYPTSDILSMGSPLVSKVKDACAQLSHVATSRRSSSGAGPHHPLDLFIGNPFLTRVNPAPISSLLPNCDHLVTPSSGLLNASIKARDCELKDRIVFFA